MGGKIYTLICKFYTFSCIIYTLNCKINTLNCKVYTFNCKIYTLTCKVYTLNCKVYTLNCKIYTLNCKIYTFLNSIFQRDFVILSTYDHIFSLCYIEDIQTWKNLLLTIGWSYHAPISVSNLFLSTTFFINTLTI